MDGIVSGVVRDAYLKELGVNGWSDLTTHSPYSYLQEPYESRSPEALRQDYPQLYSGASGPTPRALAAASTPSGAFFYFLQPQLWEDIAAEPNGYFEASLDERVQGQHVKQLSRELKHQQFKAKSLEDIREEVQRMPILEARELCVFIGLLLARSVVPNKEKLANHWKTREEGAIPRGRFGRFMTRDRFMHISRNLHFSSNGDPRAATDRSRKLRPVVDALQDRFAAGYTPPAVMAFDHERLPSRSTFNLMRVYIKDKPHKWGTNLFMFFEVFCVKKERSGQRSSADQKSDPAAVVRNLKQVLGPTAPPNGEMRLVVMDRFYSSVPLSMQLLTVGFNSIGTVRTDRQGLSTKLIPKKLAGDKKKPPKIKRLGHVQPDRIVRRDKLTREQHEVACPRIVKDYQTYMDGVDVHDQLRLQRYSLQLCIKYKKNYKGLFLGLVDLAIIDSYIVFNAARAASNLLKTSYIEFLKQLHLELCQLRDEDWEGLIVDETFQATPLKDKNTVRIRRRSHTPILNDEWRRGNNNQGRKRRTRACTVCSLLKGAGTGRCGDSSSYVQKPMAWCVFLCEKKRHTLKGKLLSCFDIWHKSWRNGALAPAPQHGGKRTIRARAPAQHPAQGNDSDEDSRHESIVGNSRQQKRARRVVTD
ncbi:hypothetical protein L916_14371 [Phytophthora nicotianae]|uniref:PiggyBac transposable element-derived protein domain-containing protein n=1 Tax=Phytophthora nicotianae TaxID=4792 RepID=W2IIG2_PHYNI|nr:hypothetical protein L916_14371 [Phytophthora nicotianae]